MRSKIYLAKSNRANPDHLMMVRGLLNKFDVEIVEFKGGTYTHKPMLECDLLVVVPELQDDEEDLQYVNVGKGLHDQIHAWTKENPKNCDLLIVNQVTKHNEVMIGQFDEFDMADEDDYVNYSSVLFDYDEFGDADTMTLESILENRLGVKSKTSSTKSNTKRGYRLLIITK